MTFQSAENITDEIDLFSGFEKKPTTPPFWHRNRNLLARAAAAAFFVGVGFVLLAVYFKTLPDEERPPVVPLPLDALPSPTSYKILFRTRNRALMSYGGYIYLMRPGDVLPDGKPMLDFDKRKKSNNEAMS